MRMNGEKDEFLFLKKLERKEVVFIFSLRDDQLATKE